MTPCREHSSGGDVDRAIAEFGKCNMTVLGDGIEHVPHGDHWPTESIIAALRQSDKEIFGYIDRGVSIQNLSIATMQSFVNDWQAMGASGILLSATEKASERYEGDMYEIQNSGDFFFGSNCGTIHSLW